MKLIPIKEKLEENKTFAANSLCDETLNMTLEFYTRIQYKEPWICYYAEENGDLVGSAGFKGAPLDGKVEIAYGTFEKYRQKGIGSKICKSLVDLSLRIDPSIRITARTLPEKNFSTRILEKNNFVMIATVIDPEDGEVWEWELKTEK